MQAERASTFADRNTCSGQCLRREPIMSTSIQSQRSHTFTRRAILAATAAGALISRPIARASESVSVALDWFPNSNHVGLYWAQATGGFTNAGYDVTIQTPADPATVLQTVAGGRDTFGISYQPDVLLARDAGLPIVAVASIVPRPLLGIMSLKTTGIESPADLAGKTIGYTGIAAQEAFLSTMLEAVGKSLSDINLITIGFDLVPAVIGGSVAAVMGAYWTHETIVAENEGYPVDLLKVDDWGVPTYDELVLVASEETVRERSGMVSAITAAMTAGYLAAANDQPMALSYLQNASSDIDLAVETAGLALLADIWLAAGSTLGSFDPAHWQSFSDWMNAHGILSDAFVSTTALWEQAVRSPARHAGFKPDRRAFSHKRLSSATFPGTVARY